MATMNSVIEQVDRLTPNVYTAEDKYSWINTLEGLVAREVMNDDAPEYDLPGDADTPLLVGHPYDDLYNLYVTAMIYFYNREYEQYNNVTLLFQQRLEQYKAWYSRTHAGCNARNFRNVMG